MEPKTRDPSYGWDSGPWRLFRNLRVRTQLIGWTRGPRPGTLILLILQDTEKGIWCTYDRWDPRLKTNVSCETWDGRTMIQMNLIKCAINRIWVIIFLILSHIITAAFVVSIFSITTSLIYVYTKHICTFLGNICTHLPFIFWSQTNFAKFAGNHLCQSFFFY